MPPRPFSSFFPSAFPRPGRRGCLNGRRGLSSRLLRLVGIYQRRSKINVTLYRRSPSAQERAEKHSGCSIGAPAGRILRQASAALTALVVDTLQASGPGESISRAGRASPSQDHTRYTLCCSKQWSLWTASLQGRAVGRPPSASRRRSLRQPRRTQRRLASVPRGDDRRGAAHQLRYRQARPQPAKSTSCKGQAEMPETPLEQYT